MTTYQLFNGHLLTEDRIQAMRLGEERPFRPWKETPNMWERFASLLRVTGAKDIYVEGVDCSKWQGTWNVQQTIDQGARYGFIKATQNTFTDPKFDEYAASCAVAEFPIGCYHFADPAGRPAVEQARYFADVVKGVGELSVVLDAEWTGGLSATALNQWFYDFLMELGVHLGDRLKEIYTRASWWNLNVAPASWASDYGLWAARWADWLEGPWSDGKYVPRDWDDWTNWQYSSDGNGLGSLYGVDSNSIDLNYFHGDWPVFVEHYNLSDTPPPTEPHTHPVLASQIEMLNTQVEAMEDQMKALESYVKDHEHDGVTPPLEDDFIMTQAKKETDGTGKAVVHIIVGYDKACAGQVPPGKPIPEPPKYNRVVYRENEPFGIKKHAAVSCKDDPTNPFVLGPGNEPYCMVADGWPGAGDLVRLDKITL
jgi:GH25 family lysozyme M1 (1,4-beta-N-acetylmuramidase)